MKNFVELVRYIKCISDCATRLLDDYFIKYVKNTRKNSRAILEEFDYFRAVAQTIDDYVVRALAELDYIDVPDEAPPIDDFSTMFPPSMEHLPSVGTNLLYRSGDKL